jgi:CitMHS family citrate-Mg2+:H+ or citrate-Ca2+:H+ symporter
VGLAKVEFADHQKFTLKWAIAISMLLMVGSLLFGLYPSPPDPLPRSLLQ